ncbi:MerR family transcriptional regulator [Micromonospora sp. WMMA2032]|uniref:DNA-binding transcriptional regulator, MerR family n=1 Tax=Micromonospora sediminicola TaxID=946078 RepID=A0A1A9BAJ5_9ACTN|nr:MULTISPECIES: MerR family transcriptional regulator [Micromonospora]ATO12553.1 MerR family transcriptional regulator [Micromonospora sp. WMMA2032]PGH44270.1 MerR family transcriptional regulator [Micromonospora sp. WMMA1996]SBT65999.1 DNA-binding transcriptional regulator, MerR family [Micromonospora sediminicola]
MRIGELSARTGVSARSIRYYEQQGLLAAVRNAGGQRVFAESAVERVDLIRRLFDAGLSSRRMSELLPCVTNPDIRTGWLTDRLREERSRMVAEMARLAHAVSVLDDVVADMTVPGEAATPAA